MPRRPKHSYPCDHYTWLLFQRGQTFYADGRGNTPNLGKHSLATTDKREAQANLRQLDLQMAIKWKKIAPAPPTPNAQLLLEEGWERYLAYCGRPELLGGVSPKTCQRYKALRDSHLPFCRQKGYTTWNSFDGAALTAFVAWLNDRGYAPATLCVQVTVIKQVVNFLVDAHLLSESARTEFKKIKQQRSEESSTYCYTTEQVDAMVELCRGEPQLRWLGNLIWILARTGTRIGELLSLRWSAVNLETGTISIRDNRFDRAGNDPSTRVTTKTKRSRVVPIHRTLLMPVLRRMAAEALAKASSTTGTGAQSTTALLPGRVFELSGKPLRNTSVLASLKKVIRRLAERFPTPPGERGFADGTIHSLRHHFVSEAFISGIDEGTIRSWTGHRTSRIVERYRHLNSDDSARKMELISSERPSATGGAKATRAKRPVHPDQDAHGNEEVSELPVAAKRGRPRKVKAVARQPVKRRLKRFVKPSAIIEPSIDPKVLAMGAAPDVPGLAQAG